MGKSVVKLAHQAFGVIMSINFMICWAIPIAGMGQLWKLGLKFPITPLYNWFDRNTYMRKFAASYIYGEEKFSDFFFTSLLIVVNAVVGLGIMFYWQLTTRGLPYWLIFAYYCSWVGMGGRVMGAAYALAHREGHKKNMYNTTIRKSVGNFFENWLGLFYGIVPASFTTSHISIHHQLNGGIGDTFYQWDLNRNSFGDFMLYLTRIFLHMTGYSSCMYYLANNKESHYKTLSNGGIKYMAGAAIVLAITRSPSFLFWIYFQPLLCMTYFLALINFGFHGFIAFDSKQNPLQTVNATCIIEGDDDYWGEDDHMAHHYNPSIYFRDLPAHQQTKVDQFKKERASVFKGLSIVELSIFILIGKWDLLADHYVDYTGKMERKEIEKMLKVRARATECSWEDYQDYLENPTLEMREKMKTTKFPDQWAEVETQGQNEK